MRKVQRARPSGRICILSGTSDENEFEKASDIVLTVPCFRFPSFASVPVNKGLDLCTN